MILPEHEQIANKYREHFGEKEWLRVNVNISFFELQPCSRNDLMNWPKTLTRNIRD
jgi:hypothetical protein